jgi:hypothetical protein
MDDHRIEQLLSSLHAGTDLVRAAKQCGVSLHEAAVWSGTREGGGAIASLRRLAQSRAALAVSRARVDAARALVKLARDLDSKETARKACVDLLRLDEAAAGESPVTMDEAPISAEERQAWLAALEHLGSPTPDPPLAKSAPTTKETS